MLNSDISSEVVSHTSMDTDLNEPDGCNVETSTSNSNTFNDSNMSMVINESENALFKVEIKRLNLKINHLKNQPFSFSNIEDTDSLITYYTGMPNKAIINLFDIFKNIHETYFLDWKVEKINRTDQILMTFIKLRLNFDFIDLGVRFGCSRKTVTIIVMT